MVTIPRSRPISSIESAIELRCTMLHASLACFIEAGCSAFAAGGPEGPELSLRGSTTCDRIP